jgi:nucleoside 2-deoxyribosyltransferase
MTENVTETPKSAYLALSFEDREKHRSLITTLRQALEQQGWQTLAPVFDWNESVTDYSDLMNKAFLAIRNSKVIVAELSNKSVGVGIEIGYAKSLQIPIIYIKDKSAPLSTTASGTADYYYEYENPDQVVSYILDICRQINLH